MFHGSLAYPKSLFTTRERGTYGGFVKADKALHLRSKTDKIGFLGFPAVSEVDP